VALFREGDARPKLWSVDRREPTCVALNGSETLAACGLGDGGISIAALPGGETTAELRGHADRVLSLAFSGSDSLLASASRDETIRLWRARGKKWENVLTLRPLGGVVEAVRFSGDGKQLIVLVYGETALRVWRIDLIRQKLAAMGIDW
jgi:WD40 repeat protein